VRDSAKADADRAEARLSGGAPQLTPEIIQRFASEAKARMRRANGDYRRHHLQAIAQRIEVGEDVIRIKGTRTNLLRTIVGKEAGPSPEGMGGVSKGDRIVVKTTATEVRSFVPKWLRG